MIEFGNTLRQAREAKGYTIAQVAERTNMMGQLIEDLEKENFSNIAAPVYGRGFVRLYCECVGLDAKPMIAEFMDIYNGNREPTIRMKESVTERAMPKPEPPAAPAPDPEPKVQAEAPRASESPAPVTPQPEEDCPPEPPPITDFFSQATRPAAVPEAPTVNDVSEPDAPTPAPARKPSRYAMPTPIDEQESKPFTMPTIPPQVWRIGMLVITATLLFILTIFGVKALYNLATKPSDPAAATNTPESVPEAQTPDAKQAAPHQPKMVAPLYLD